MYKSSIVLLSLFSVLLFSCQKEVMQSDSSTSVSSSENRSDLPEVKYEWYLDLKPVKEGTYSPDDEQYFHLTEGVQTEGNQIFQMHAFSTEQGYIAYGDSKGWRLGLITEMEKHLAAYAERTGADVIAEQTGEVPQWYTDYEQAYVKKMWNFAGVQDRSSIAMLHKELFSGGSNFPTLPGIGLPIMWPGWNNQTSAFTPLLIGGVHKVYDRTFYRSRMRTFVGFLGFSRIPFFGPLAGLNNRASSWWSFGL